MGKTNRQVGGEMVPENELRCTASAAQIDWFSSEEDEDFSRFSRVLSKESDTPGACLTRDCPTSYAEDVARYRQEQMREVDETDRAWRMHQGKDIPVPEPSSSEPTEKAAWLAGEINPA
jgi:hypothetical protein